jgi:hypothetical protein
MTRREPDPSDRLRILVTGSPWWQDRTTVYAALSATWAAESGPRGLLPLTVIHSDTLGAPMIAGHWSRGMRAAGAPVNEEIHTPDFHRLRESAEVVQNWAMVLAGAHVCLAFIVGDCPAAQDCVDKATQHGIRVVPHQYRPLVAAPRPVRQPTPYRRPA